MAIDAMTDFHFLRPLALLLIPLLAILWLRGRNRDSAMGGWSRAVDPELLAFLYRGQTQMSDDPRRPWLASAAWILACVALAGPTWDRSDVKLKRDRAALVAVLDLSPSMLAADVLPSRLERARFKLKDLLTRYAGGSTGLVVFGARAYPIAPLTQDAQTLVNLVDVLAPEIMPAAGARLDLGIEQAMQLIERAGLKRGKIVVLTDGVNQRAFAAAERARAAGISISIIGVGTSAGAPVALPQGGFVTDSSGQMALSRVDEGELMALASAAGGKFVRLSADDQDLQALALDAPSLEPAALQETNSSIQLWQDRGPYLLLLLLPLAALAFRRGVLLAALLVFCIPQAEAFSMADLWLRTDQQAARALAKGDARAAADLAVDRELKGSALYRDKRFQQASENFGGSYNRGTALASAGALEDSLKALESAVKEDPNNADAQHNLGEVKRALEQQKQDQQKQDQQKKDQQEKDGQKDDKQDQQKQEQDQQKQEQDQQKQEQQQKDQNAQKQEGEKEKSESDQQQADKEEAEKEQADKEQAEKEQAEKEQADKEKAEQQKAEQAEQDQQGKPADEKNAQPQPAPRPEDRLPPEERQALEQWLNRVPDDPAGLIRRQLQRKAQIESASSDLEEDEQW